MDYMVYAGLRILLVYMWIAFMASDIPTNLRKQLNKEFYGILLVYILIEGYIYYLYQLMQGVGIIR